MSEKMIARWNAIPLERPEMSDSVTLKRERPEEDQDDEDDMSLISRSPSPPAHDSMEVDEQSTHKYDEYVRGPAREVITVNTKIKSTNKGFELLTKLGWVEGQPVGLSADGRTEPVPFHMKSDLTGLGKTSQDVRMIETTVSQRRELDSERQQKESDEQRKLREDAVARKTALESEISSTLRAFYCELCDKQFKNVAQYDEHTNSYAHHHKARAKDMQANIRIKPQDDIDKRKEKERKREEKELRKIAAANGIKMPKPSTISSSTTPLAPTSFDAPKSSGMDIDNPTEPKQAGWATVRTSVDDLPNPSGGFRKSGWATFGGGSSSSVTPLPPPPPPPTQPLPDSSINHPRHPGATGSEPLASARTTPMFRNAGWTSLETGSSQPPPAVQTSWAASSEPQIPSSTGGGWSRATSSEATTTGSAASLSSSSRQWPQSPPDSSVSQMITPHLPQGLPPPPPLPPSQTAPPPPSVPPPEPTKPVRSNWQQFQKSAGRRR